VIVTSNSSLSQCATDNLFKVFHQNIRGLKDKTNELIGSLLPELPPILCVTEHHLKAHELGYA
jgi:hypothetical protein